MLVVHLARPRVRRTARRVGLPVWLTCALVCALAPSLTAAQAPSGSTSLPATVRAVIEEMYGADSGGLRYVDGAFDLNSDGQAEIVVYLVGSVVCGSGGCPTLIFTPRGAGYVLVSKLTVTNPPIRAAAQQTHGWHDLVVHVRGGGAAGRDVALAFTGKSYPPNPTTAGTRLAPAAVAGATIIVADFQSFEQTKPFAPPSQIP